jgi:IS30 family transposase
VRRARRERGRDQEKGKPVEDSSGLGRDERRRRVQHLKSLGRSAREIAHALGIPYSTVLRDLGKKT